MTETKPRSEQIRFISTKTGEHVLNEYLEACERNSIPLYDLMDTIFDSAGDVNPNFIEFRFEETAPQTYAFQFRLGANIAPEANWQTISDPVFQEIINDTEDSKTAAIAAANTSIAKAAEALTSANNANTSATNAATSATLAQNWAIKTPTPVTGSEYSAKKHAQDAASSAAAAAASAAQGMYREVVDINTAQSPFTPTLIQEGILFRIDTSAGPVSVVLNSLANYTEDMKFAFVKEGASNATISRTAPDTIVGGGAVSNVVTITADYETHVLIGDFDHSQWINIIQKSTSSATDVPVSNAGFQVLTGTNAQAVFNSTDTNIKSLQDTKMPLAPRVQSVTSAATITPTSTNDMVIATAQAAALTIANPTGTMSQGQCLVVRIKDNGTARTITWGSNYRALSGSVLPATTTISKTLYAFLIWNATDTKYDLVGVGIE